MNSYNKLRVHLTDKPQRTQQRLETNDAYGVLKVKTRTTPLYEQTLDRAWHIALQALSVPVTETLRVLSMLNPDAMTDVSMAGLSDISGQLGSEE